MSTLRVDIAWVDHCYPAANTRSAILRCGLLLHRWDCVRVGVEGDRDGGVTQSFGDHLGVDTGAQRQGGVRVTQVVQTDGRQCRLLTACRKKRLTASGCRASPSSRVKIKPVSVQLLAVACSTS